MIIPVKCFTCGKVIADKYRYYLAEVRKKKLSRDLDVDKVIYMTAEYIDKTPEGEVMDSLGLKKNVLQTSYDDPRRYYLILTHSQNIIIHKSHFFFIFVQYNIFIVYNTEY